MITDYMTAGHTMCRADFVSGGVKSVYTPALGHISGCLRHSLYAYPIALFPSVGHASVARSVVHCHAAGMHHARHRRASMSRRYVRGFFNDIFPSRHNNIGTFRGGVGVPAKGMIISRPCRDTFSYLSARNIYIIMCIMADRYENVSLRGSGTRVVTRRGQSLG